LEIILAFGSREKIPSIFGKGYASFLVRSLILRASKHNRTLPVLATILIGELQAPFDFAITPNSIIRSISEYSSDSTAGETSLSLFDWFGYP